MEKTLKNYKDEVLAVLTQEIDRCHSQHGIYLANRSTVIAGVFEEVRDSVIKLRTIVGGISLEEPTTPESEAEK